MVEYPPRRGGGGASPPERTRAFASSILRRMSSGTESEAESQRRYFESVERSRIAVVDTPYVRRHVDELGRDAAFAPGMSLLEIGAGPGKFTRLLVEAGLRVTANDVSPVLLARLAEATGGRAEPLAGDAHDLAALTSRTFDRVAGFFVLHHLTDFPRLFASIFGRTAPGGRIAFCEPVGRNPLYALQIALTPGMTFEGEPSIFEMRAAVILPAMEAAGFTRCRARSYGYFPPALANLSAGRALERALEAVPFPFPHAFQVFSGERP